MNPTNTASRQEGIRKSALNLLYHWARSAEKDWTFVPGHPKQGVYGTGYGGWGTQTQQKYVSAVATLADSGDALPECDLTWARERALAALRFNLSSHKTGQSTCTDGSQWGHSWISALGIERMMFSLPFLSSWLTDEDQDAMRALLCSEADWLLYSYQRGSRKGISAGKWGSDGNDPESNLWNGALLWRTAVMYPDHPHAGDWQEEAHRFLINGVSVESDASDESILAEKPVRERHLGGNFFPHYALDHHGYLNVGYMAICVSNAAMLHLDLKAAGLPAPESLHHHQRDLWQVLRRMIFSNGRLARIGGDTRVRYAYCQEYLLPSLLYAADQLGEPFAFNLIEQQLCLIEKEAQYNADGAFYSRRLASLRNQSPLYFTRLESDRASTLAMLATYATAVCVPNEPIFDSFEESVSGSWIEPEHGAAIHRSPTRFASFSWRAFHLAQGLCLPPDEGNRAEWEYNLGGRIEFCHHPHPHHAGPSMSHRRIGTYSITEFPGGFSTCGEVTEGTNLHLAESWTGTDSAKMQTAFSALPDDHTVIGLHFAKMGDRRGYVSSVKGLHLNVPNDLYQDHQLALSTASGKISLRSPTHTDEVVSLKSNWAQLPGRIGVVGIYGAESLTLHRTPERNAGVMKTLHSETLCYPLIQGPICYEAGEPILDSGWLIISGKSAEETRKASEQHPGKLIECKEPNLRAVRVRAQDGASYLFVANFGSETIRLPLASALDSEEYANDLQTEEEVTEITLAPTTARLLSIS